MTAPNTNVEKQTKRHFGPIAGISLALAAAVAAGIYFTAMDEVENDAAAADGTPAAVEEMADS